MVVPSGERWPDDSLRPCVEDLWGAGGRALAAAGFADDVAVAAQLDASDVVPVLDGEAFTPAG